MAYFNPPSDIQARWYLSSLASMDQLWMMPLSGARHPQFRAKPASDVRRDSLLTQRTKRFVQLHNLPDRERWSASIALTNGQPLMRAGATEGIQAQLDELLLIRFGTIHLGKKAVISLSNLQEQRRCIAQTLRESGVPMLVPCGSVGRRKALLAERDQIVDFVQVELKHLQHQRARQLSIATGDHPSEILVQIARCLATRPLRCIFQIAAK